MQSNLRVKGKLFAKICTSSLLTYLSYKSLSSESMHICDLSWNETDEIIQKWIASAYALDFCIVSSYLFTKYSSHKINFLMLFFSGFYVAHSDEAKLGTRCRIRIKKYHDQCPNFGSFHAIIFALTRTGRKYMQAGWCGRHVVVIMCCIGVASGWRPFPQFIISGCIRTFTF